MQSSTGCEKQRLNIFDISFSGIIQTILTSHTSIYLSIYLLIVDMILTAETEQFSPTISVFSKILSFSKTFFEWVKMFSNFLHFSTQLYHFMVHAQRKRNINRIG